MPVDSLAYELDREQWEDIVARVQRGAARLDEVHPDWRQEVSPHSLDMSSASMCVLGQAFGGYCRGLEDIRPNDDEQVSNAWATLLGFDLCLEPSHLQHIDGFDDIGGAEPWFILEELWTAVIQGHDPMRVAKAYLHKPRPAPALR